MQKIGRRLGLGLTVVILLVFGFFIRHADGFRRSLPPMQNTIVPPLEDQFSVNGCSGLGGNRESCYWRYAYDNTVCNKKNPCSKLVMYFSGGEMHCDDSFGKADATYSRILRAYAKDGYIAVCAGTFMTEAASAEAPSNTAATRVDMLVKNIRLSPAIRSVWNGDHLLFAGISYGATAPVIAMARTPLDSQPSWKGAKTTAGCFLDGIYDVPAIDTFLTHSTTPIACNRLRGHTICQRYFGTDASCPAATLNNPAVALDTITKVPPTTFAIKNWKLVECGSALPACAADGDWVPAGPIGELCTSLQASPGYTCTYGSLPTQSHVDCAGTPEGISACQSWFDVLVVGK